MPDGALDSIGARKRRQTEAGHTGTSYAAPRARMAPTVAPKAACTDGARHGTTRRAARVAVCPLVPCRGQGMSAMAGGTRHIGFYYAATRARMTPAVAAKDACTRGAMGTTVRCPPVVPGPLARGSHCPPCPRPWKPPWFPMLAGGPQFRSSPVPTSGFVASKVIERVLAFLRLHLRSKL